MLHRIVVSIVKQMNAEEEKSKRRCRSERNVQLSTRCERFAAVPQLLPLVASGQSNAVTSQVDTATGRPSTSTNSASKPNSNSTTTSLRLDHVLTQTHTLLFYTLSHHLLQHSSHRSNSNNFQMKLTNDHIFIYSWRLEVNFMCNKRFYMVGMIVPLIPQRVH